MPRTGSVPVKTTNDLLVLRSDCFARRPATTSCSTRSGHASRFVDLDRPLQAGRRLRRSASPRRAVAARGDVAAGRRATGPSAPTSSCVGDVDGRRADGPAHRRRTATRTSTGPRPSEVRTLDEHRDAILAALSPLPPRHVAAGGVLSGSSCAEDVVALVDLPGFDNSAMDGYAVRAADVAAATRQDRRSPAGRRGDRGRCRRGLLRCRPGHRGPDHDRRAVPEGADAVVPGRVHRRRRRRRWRSSPASRGWASTSGRAGEDVAAGDRSSCAAGAVLGAAPARAARGGRPRRRCSVRPRPRVAIVLHRRRAARARLGPLAPAQIVRLQLATMLAAAVQAAGAEPLASASSTTTPPRAATLSSDRLRRDADLIVTSGGVSHGRLRRRQGGPCATHGVEFVQVAMQPGKPQGFGLRRRPDGADLHAARQPGVVVRLVRGLRPARAARLMGRDAGAPRPTCRPGWRTRSSSPPGRAQVARGRASRTDEAGGGRTRSAGQASHFVADLARANALVARPRGRDAGRGGRPGATWLLDDPGAG